MTSISALMPDSLLHLQFVQQASSASLVVKKDQGHGRDDISHSVPTGRLIIRPGSVHSPKASPSMIKKPMVCALHSIGTCKIRLGYVSISSFFLQMKLIPGLSDESSTTPTVTPTMPRAASGNPRPTLDKPTAGMVRSQYRRGGDEA